MELQNEYLRRHEAIEIASYTFTGSHKLAVCECYTGCQWCANGATKLPKSYVITNGEIRHCITKGDLRVIRDVETWLRSQEVAKSDRKHASIPPV